MPSTKSVTGILIDLLIDDGKIRSLDQRVCEFLADWCVGLRGQVTLRHLLSMTSGLPTMQDSTSVVPSQRFKPEYVLLCVDCTAR